MPTDPASPFSRRLALLLFVVIACLWLANIGHRVLQHPDEGRYAEIAREMAVTGDWVTPRLSGLKYFEKPPLQYWLTAGTFDVFGAHAWTARLWPAVAGLLGVVAIGYAGLRLGGPALGWSAGLALAGTLWQIALSQILTLDALLSTLLTVGFVGFVVAQQPEATTRFRRTAMWVTWAALAGATLTKGPIGIVIPGAALVLYSAFTRDLAVWRRLHLASGLALYIALTAPWFIAVSLANPEFASFFFIHEHVDRFLTPSAHRPGSIFYFVPLLVGGALPWLTLLAYGAPRAWRKGTGNALGFSWQRFALVWAAFVFVFFSVSSSKLPSYILPMFPPLALLAGWLLLELSPAELVRAMLPVALIESALAAVAVVGYPAIAAEFADPGQPMQALLAFGPWVKAGVVVAAAGALVGIACLRRQDSRGRFAGIVAFSVSTLVMTQLVVGGLDSFRATRSSYDILRTAAARLADPGALSSPAIPFFQVDMYDQTVPFYLHRTTTVVAFEGELALGIAADPERAIRTIPQWVARWAQLREGYAVIPPQAFDRLAQEGVPMRVLARDTRRVVVSR